MSHLYNNPFFFPIAIVVCWLSLNNAHAATLNGPATLAVSASDGVLDLDLNVFGDLYFEAGDFPGDALHLSADVAVHILDETTLWPHASAVSLNLSDAESITVDGDVRLTGDASWANSTARLTSTGTIFVTGSGLNANELTINAGEVVLIRDGSVVGRIERSETDGANEPVTPGGGSSGSVFVVSHGGSVQNTGQIQGTVAVERPGEFSDYTTFDFPLTFNIQVAEVSSVPLPGSFVLFALGLAGLARARETNRPSGEILQPV